MGTGHVITYYKPKGQENASFSDLSDLLDTDIESLLSDLQNITSSDVWNMCASDFRTNLQDRWLLALRVFIIGHNLAISVDESHGLVRVDQLDQKVIEIGIFKSSNIYLDYSKNVTLLELEDEKFRQELLD